MSMSQPPISAQTTVDAAAKHRAVMAVLPALMVTLLLAFVDNMIVSTALPRIVGELGGVDHLAWVITAYILTMTVSTPLFGEPLCNGYVRVLPSESRLTRRTPDRLSQADGGAQRTASGGRGLVIGSRDRRGSCGYSSPPE